MVYATIPSFNIVTVIDGATDTAVKNLIVGMSPTGIDVNPNTNLIYVANGHSNTISVRDSTI